MFMHMPTRAGIVVFVIVAVCLGTYYVLALREPDLGDWRVWQGRGELISRDGASWIGIGYSVKHPDRPLFAWLGLEPPERVEPDTALVLRYRSEGAAMIVVHVRERDGSAWQAARLLAPTAQWTEIDIRAGDFLLEAAPGNVDENDRVDFEQLTSRVEFFAGTGSVLPTIVFVNRIDLAAPVFARGAPAVEATEPETKDP